MFVCFWLCVSALYLDAHLGAKARLNDSTYETEKEFGVGKRRKRVQMIESDDDDDDAPVVKVSASNTRGLFSAKKTVTSSVKILPKGKPRDADNNATLKVVRRDRGSKAESLTALKEMLKAQKETTASRKPPIMVCATSPNWKASSLDNESTIKHVHDLSEEEDDVLTRGQIEKKKKYESNEKRNSQKIDGQINDSCLKNADGGKKSKKKVEGSEESKSGKVDGNSCVDAEMIEIADGHASNEDHADVSRQLDDYSIFGTPPSNDLEQSIEKSSSVKKSPRRSTVAKKLFQPISPIVSSGKLLFPMSPFKR